MPIPTLCRQQHIQISLLELLGIDIRQLAARTIKQAADDRSVVHGVLDSEVPKRALAPDVDETISRTEQLEKKLPLCPPTPLRATLT